MSDYSDVLKVAPAKVGEAEVVHDSPSGIDRIRGAMDGMPLTREKYVRLLVRGSVMMSDAEFERRTNSVVFTAKGDALVAGLGIGLILEPLLKRCASVTVVEKSADVIKLVGPHYPKCRIVHADIYKWVPENGTKYDFIYFDIWGEFSEDSLDEAEILEAAFRKRLNKGGFMGSWCRTALRAQRRRR